MSLFNGGLVDQATDIDCANGDPTLIFMRVYNSLLSDHAGLLGPGWSCGFERYIVDLGDEGAAEVDGRGVELFFPSNGAGGYAAPRRGGVTLTRDALGWRSTYTTGVTYAYTSNGQLSSISAPYGRVTTLTYSSTGDLARVTGRGGRTLEFQVTGGLLRSVTSSGLTCRYAYTPDGRLAVVTNTRNRATSFSYTSSGGLASTLYPSGDTVQYQYTVDGKVSQVSSISATTGTTSTSRITYGPAGLRTYTDAANRTVRFTYNDAAALVRREDPDGRTWTAEYDAEGRATKVVLPDGKTQSWTYSGTGVIASYTSPGGVVTSVTRDPATDFPTTLNLPNQTTVQRAFDASGGVVASIDGKGNRTTYVRNAAGDVTQTIDASGRVSRAEYSADGLLLNTTDALRNVSQIDHDVQGRVIRTTSPEGRTRDTEYTGRGLVSATTDSLGSRTANEYDDLGRLTATVLANTARTEYMYGWINGTSVVTAIKDPIGNVSQSEYDDAAQLVKSRDQLGRETVFTRDKVGRVTRVDYPDKRFSLTRYGDLGQVSETENARGAITRYFYDDDHRLVRTQLADGGSTSQEYDVLDRVVKQVAPNGGVSQTIFDGAGLQTATIDPLKQMARTEYTPTGAVAKSIDVLGRETNFDHDAVDRTIATTDPIGLTTLQHYTADGYVDATTNRRGKVTRFEFDKNGRLIATTDPLQGAVNKSYDPVGNLTSVKDENGHIWKFEYDLLSRKIKETDPDGHVTKFEYTAVGAIERIVFPEGVEWRYTKRDAADRLLTRELVRNGVVEDMETFAYNIVGSRTLAENGTVRVESEYDIMERETHRTVTWKRTGAVRELRFAWDIMGRRQAMADSHGRMVTYRYDLLSRPTLITELEPNPHSTGIADMFFPRAYAFSWDAVGNLKQVDYPNGTRTRREFDKLDRLTRLVHERLQRGPRDADDLRKNGASAPDEPADELASWKIERDENSNPVKITRDGHEVWSFENDALDRLVAAHLPHELVERLRAQDPAKGSRGGGDHGGDDRDEDEHVEKLIGGSGAGDITYKYDPAGNRLEESIGGRVITSTFGNVNQMLTRGSMSFGYDPRGNETEKVYKSGRREVYTYSVAGKLASFSTGHVGSDKLKEIEKYLSAPDGERVLVEDVQSGQLAHSVWDGSRQIEDFHQVGHGQDAKDVGALYVRDLGEQLLETTAFERRLGVTAHRRPVDDDDHEDSDRDDGPAPAGARLRHVRWTHQDMLGSSSLISNYRGNVLQRYQYAPWGERLEGDWSKLRFGYTGHSNESTTGNWGALRRYLDPRAGRWTQRDPARDADSENRYQYALNDPLTLSDPQGSIVVGIYGAGGEETGGIGAVLGAINVQSGEKVIAIKPGYVTGVLFGEEIAATIKKERSNCQERVVIIGYSKGGEAAVDAANALGASTFAQERTNVDYLGVIDAFDYPSPPPWEASGLSSPDHRLAQWKIPPVRSSYATRANVKRGQNFHQSQAGGLGATVSGIDDVRIVGALVKDPRVPATKETMIHHWTIDYDIRVVSTMILEINATLGAGR